MKKSMVASGKEGNEKLQWEKITCMIIYRPQTLIHRYGKRHMENFMPYCDQEINIK